MFIKVLELFCNVLSLIAFADSCKAVLAWVSDHPLAFLTATIAVASSLIAFQSFLFLNVGSYCFSETIISFIDLPYGFPGVPNLLYIDWATSALACAKPASKEQIATKKIA